MTAKLLVAEDDIFVREMIAEFLRDAGFDVVEAGNADEAMAVFESGAEIDLLFRDVRMPGSMDGSALAGRVPVFSPGFPARLNNPTSAQCGSPAMCP